MKSPANDVEVLSEDVRPPVNGSSSFSEPSLARVDEDDAVDFFSRSRDSHFDYELEERKLRAKRAQKLARRKAKEEAKKRESQSIEPEQKKRRISAEEPLPRISPPEDRSEPAKEKKPVLLLDSDDDVPNYSFHNSDTQPDSSTILDPPPNKESDDELVFISEKTPAANGPEEDEEDDPYLRELAEKARAKANGQFSPVKQASTPTLPSETPPALIQQPDAVITLYLASPMVEKDFETVGVKIKTSHSLLDARKIWCQRNKIPSSEWPDYIMLWNKKRVWDVSTPEGLGYRLTDDGSRIFEPGSLKSSNPKKVNLHLDVLTEEYWAKLKAEEAAAELPEEEPVEEVSTKKDDGSFKITLRSKDRQDQRLRIRPDSSVSKLAYAFRKFHKLPDNVSVAVYFDGEELDGEETATSLDLSAEDTLEVYVR